MFIAQLNPITVNFYGKVDWADTEWLLITPEHAEYRQELHGIWIMSMPLENFIVKNTEIGDYNEIDVDKLTICAPLSMTWPSSGMTWQMRVAR